MCKKRTVQVGLDTVMMRRQSASTGSCSYHLHLEICGTADRRIDFPHCPANRLHEEKRKQISIFEMTAPWVLSFAAL